MFVAWVGNPRNEVPFYYLEKLTSVKVFVGIAFDQTSPEGIECLLDNKHTVVIVDADQTYHPKLYFFKSQSKTALLIGSSNFTYSGFFENIEANVLIEGKEHEDSIKKYFLENRKGIDAYKQISPNKTWLKEYKKRYRIRQENLKQSKTKEESIREDNLALASSWLNKAEWEIYLKQIKKGMGLSEKIHGESVSRKIACFTDYSGHLKIPWTPTIFDTIENRRRILGKGKYAWLGHVGASGRIQQLLASGSMAEKRVIANAINDIAKLKMPLDYGTLKKELNKLEKLGPTVKVWGRVLAITRPDIYCTISSESVRKSLAILLHKPKSYFETIDGYIDLLKLIHQSPWFNSLRPKNKSEEDIWLRRVAFLDVVFY